MKSQYAVGQLVTYVPIVPKYFVVLAVHQVGGEYRYDLMTSTGFRCNLIREGSISAHPAFPEVDQTDIDASYEELILAFLRQGFTRLHIYEQLVDEAEDIPEFEYAFAHALVQHQSEVPLTTLEQERGAITSTPLKEVNAWMHRHASTHQQRYYGTLEKEAYRKSYAVALCEWKVWKHKKFLSHRSKPVTVRV